MTDAPVLFHSLQPLALYQIAFWIVPHIVQSKEEKKNGERFDEVVSWSSLLEVDLS